MGTYEKDADNNISIILFDIESDAIVKYVYIISFIMPIKNGNLSFSLLSLINK